MSDPIATLKKYAKENKGVKTEVRALVGLHRKFNKLILLQDAGQPSFIKKGLELLCSELAQGVSEIERKREGAPDEDWIENYPEEKTPAIPVGKEDELRLNRIEKKKMEIKLGTLLIARIVKKAKIKDSDIKLSLVEEAAGIILSKNLDPKKTILDLSIPQEGQEKPEAVLAKYIAGKLRRSKEGLGVSEQIAQLLGEKIVDTRRSEIKLKYALNMLLELIQLKFNVLFALKKLADQNRPVGKSIGTNYVENFFSKFCVLNVGGIVVRSRQEIREMELRHASTSCGGGLFTRTTSQLVQCFDRILEAMKYTEALEQYEAKKLAVTKSTLPSPQLNVVISSSVSLAPVRKSRGAFSFFGGEEFKKGDKEPIELDGGPKQPLLDGAHGKSGYGSMKG